MVSEPIDVTVRAEHDRILRELAAERAAEAAAALLVGSALRALRDERLYAILGARDLASLLGRELPSLDRRSARALVAIADLAESMADPMSLLSLGLARLTILASAHPDDRADVIAIAADAPRSELRRQLHLSRDARLAMAARAGSRGDAFVDALIPTGEAPLTDATTDVATAARSLLGSAERAWRELGVHAFAEARLVARIVSSELWRASESRTLAAYTSDTLDLTADELAREMRLVELFGALPVTLRERIGITALRALAAITDDERRAAIAAELRTDLTLVGEALIARARPDVAPGPSLAAGTAPTVQIATGAVTVDPTILVPLDVLFLPDVAEHLRPAFADATPEDLATQILLRASAPGELVYDLTAGSGTFARLGAALGRTVISYDLVEPPLAPGIRIGDARTIEPPEGKAALVVLDLPAPDGISATERYGERTRGGDLAIMEPDAYSKALRAVISHAVELVRPGGTLCVIAPLARFHGRLYDWPGRTTILAEGEGFTLVDRVHAVRSPAERRSILARTGISAGRDRRTVQVVLSASFFAASTRK